MRLLPKHRQKSLPRSVIELSLAKTPQFVRIGAFFIGVTMEIALAVIGVVMGVIGIIVQTN
jgi:hypothetical protein